MALKRLQEVDVDGIGVVFNDDFTGVDLDNAIDDSGAIKPWAAEILKECPTYTEKSPSGTGLHLITAGSLQKGWKGTKRAYHDGAVEIYSRGRFFTMTGDSLNGHDGDLHDYSPMIRELYKRIGGPVPTNGNGRRRPQSEPVLHVSERLELALQAPVFYRLWHGDTSGNDYDDSAADLALCNKLVFYFGPDHDLVDRLFRQSALFRPKWNRDDYRQWTINKAIDGTAETYTPKRKTSENGHG